MSWTSWFVEPDDPIVALLNRKLRILFVSVPVWALGLMTATLALGITGAGSAVQRNRQYDREQSMRYLSKIGGMKMFESPEIIIELDKAIEVDPTNTEAYLLRGRCRKFLGDTFRLREHDPFTAHRHFQLAADDFHRAVKLDPQFKGEADEHDHFMRQLAVAAGNR